MKLPRYRCTRAARSSISLAAILGTALLTAFVKPWGSFSLPLGTTRKDLLSASRLLAYSTPWELTAGSKLNQVPFVSGMLVAGLIAGFSIRRQRMSLLVTAIVDRAKPDDGIDSHDDLLVKAGLKNLLGAQDSRLAQKLEDSRRLADDMEKRMGEVRLENKRTMEELEKSRERGVKLERERDAMKRDLTEMTVELEGIRNNCERAVQQNAKTMEDLAECRAQVLEIKAERDALKKDQTRLNQELLQSEADQTRLNKELLQSEAVRKFLMEELLAARVSVSSLTTGLAEIKELVASGDAGGLEPASLSQEPAEPVPMDSTAKRTADTKPASQE